MSEVFLNMNRNGVPPHPAPRPASAAPIAAAARFHAAPDEAALVRPAGEAHQPTPAVAGGEIWIALDPAGMPVSKEEQLRGGDKRIAGALRDRYALSGARRSHRRAIGQAISGRRYRRLSRALPDRTR